MAPIGKPMSRISCVIRPPGTIVPDGLMFYPWCFFFSPRFFRDPSTDRPETLPHIRIWPYFINWLQKFGGATTKKIWGPKTCKISVNFWPLQTLIANISGKRQHIQNRKDVRTRKIHPAFKEKRPVNFSPLTCEFGPTKMHFLAYYISALRGCCVLKFLHALDIDQGYLAHTPTGTGVPPKNFNRAH